MRGRLRGLWARAMGEGGEVVDEIERVFNEMFEEWGIELPREDVAERRRGKITREGWAIWYVFGEDEGGEFMDYYASHRMTNDRHVRIRAGGECEGLEALMDMRVASEDPEEDAGLKAAFDAEQRRVGEILEAKGFGLECDEPGGVQIRRSQTLDEPEAPEGED